MNYRPKLERIKVPLLKLLLDPNNPRFLEDHADRVNEEDFADSGIQDQAVARMTKAAFRLDELKDSIATNGWQPVDQIFVRKLKALPDKYVVLEGNRRLMALRELRKEKRLDEALTSAVDPLSVLEVVDSGNIEESRAQITYLLGVRHHGSLKPWGPFAQAHNIYDRYLQIGNMTDDTFRWDGNIAAQIGAVLSIDVKKVEERLRVYCAMKQLHEVPTIKSIGIEGKSYSLVREAVAARTKSPLKQYIVQDPSTFKLDDKSIRRMDLVCHFSTKDREGAPMRSPEEWRPFAKILADVDREKSAAMVREVENDKALPSDVSAKRQAELRQPRWDRWLIEVTNLLKKLQIANLDDDQTSRTIGARLATILDNLSAVANKPAIKVN